jgi:antitoxin CptB
MDLADNDLLDLLLRRKEPEAPLDGPAVKEVLEMLRPPAASAGTGH